MKLLAPNPENHCFGCGGANAQGMLLTFELDESSRRIVGRFRIPLRYEGARGLVHGGIVATLLDEAMGKLNQGGNMPAMTAELRVNYLRPVPVEQEIVVEAHQERRVGRNLLHLGEIRDLAGNVLARGEGRFVEVDPERIREAMAPGTALQASRTEKKNSPAGLSRAESIGERR
jgi:uncharacterized protein (TIGR00369 family)